MGHVRCLCLYRSRLHQLRRPCHLGAPRTGTRGHLNSSAPVGTAQERGFGGHLTIGCWCIWGRSTRPSRLENGLLRERGRSCGRPLACHCRATASTWRLVMLRGPSDCALCRAYNPQGTGGCLAPTSDGLPGPLELRFDLREKFGSPHHSLEELLRSVSC